jgi:beta-glucuronidase
MPCSPWLLRTILPATSVSLLVACGALAQPALAKGGATKGGASQVPARVPGQEAAPGRLPVPPAPPYRVDTPEAKTLYRYGPDGRYLLAGSWLFRFDRGIGLKRHFERSTSRSGWTTVAVPNAWNAQDSSVASYAGTVAWYRKDFRLPSSAAGTTWIVRFESVNYRARVWLNGRLIGHHTGAYLPFELRLPARALDLTGVNHLVIRVDDRHGPSDLPPGGLSESGNFVGGWWNYGGLGREVYLRRVDGIDFQTVQVLPDLPCPTCPGRVTYRVLLRNYAAATQTVHLVSSFGGQQVDLGSAAVEPGATHAFTQVINVPDPHLWSPQQPNLYDVTLDANVGPQRVAHYFLRSGIRSIQVSGDGQLLLNGQILNFRGVALHEDSPQFGNAVDNSFRERWIAWVKALGATVVRAHYPLSPYLEEQADANGIMLWSEVPFYTLKPQYVAQPSVRAAGVKLVSDNVLTNSSHPAVIIWSIANELSSKPDASQSAYIAAAVQVAHTLDPTRPVGLAVSGYPSAGCQPSAYAPLQVIGINAYFGWYAGPGGQIADRDLLSDYLDAVHACYPTKSVVISEFGAEANRPGPAEERGTYAFQQDFVNYMLGLFATKQWLGGAIYFALQEFRVRPGWSGGDPRPDPPMHEKGLITFAGQLKPAFSDVQRIYRATTQLRPR